MITIRSTGNGVSEFREMYPESPSDLATKLTAIIIRVTGSNLFWRDSPVTIEEKEEILFHATEYLRYQRHSLPTDKTVDTKS